MANFRIKHPWRSGLLVATGISGLVFLATLLWQTGHAQWAFLLLFASLWVLTSLFLANDEFIEESGLILARLLDEQVSHLLDRIHHLESRLGHLDPHAVASRLTATKPQFRGEPKGPPGTA